MCPAQGSLRKKTRFGWLVSEETELLEAEGATARGIAILDELKAVYSHTGAERPIRNRVVSASRELFSNGQSEIRIIEIGARDGTLLRQIGEDLADAGIHSELHGVEFRENIVELARQRGAAAGSDATFHCLATERLDYLGRASFDIVFSAFMLHHQSRSEITRVLDQCRGLSRRFVFHLDLDRSLYGVIGIWLVYMALGSKLSRRDSVLSCRRAYRVNEMQAALEQTELDRVTTISYAPPFRWLMETTLAEAG